MPESLSIRCLIVMLAQRASAGGWPLGCFKCMIDCTGVSSVIDGLSCSSRIIATPAKVFEQLAWRNGVCGVRSG